MNPTSNDPVSNRFNIVNCSKCMHWSWLCILHFKCTSWI